MVFTTVVEQEWLLFTNGPNLSQLASYKSKVIVIDYSKDGSEKGEFTKEEIEILKKEGNKVFAYLNVGVAEEWRFYWKNFDKSLLIAPLENWHGEYYVKYWENSWLNILNEYMRRISNAAFDGVMLDWVNVYEHTMLKERTGKTERELEKFMAQLVKKLSSKFKEFEFALVNGEKLILDSPDILTESNNIKYIVIESLFFENQKLDITSKRFSDRLSSILKAQSMGIKVLSVEYIDNGNPFDKANSDRIKNYVLLAKKYNFLYYIARSDMKLNTINIPQIMD